MKKKIAIYGARQFRQVVPSERLDAAYRLCSLSSAAGLIGFSSLNKRQLIDIYGVNC